MDVRWESYHSGQTEQLWAPSDSDMESGKGRMTYGFGYRKGHCGGGGGEDEGDGEERKSHVQKNGKECRAKVIEYGERNLTTDSWCVVIY